MELIIYFKDSKTIELRLSKDGELIEVLEVWPLNPALVDKGGVDIHFDTMLVTSIDKIIKRNRIETSSLKTVKIEGQVDPLSVAYQIARAVVSAIKS